MSIKSKIHELSLELTKAMNKLNNLINESKNADIKRKYIKNLKEALFFSNILLEIDEKKSTLDIEYVKYEIKNIENFCEKINDIDSEDLPF